MMAEYRRVGSGLGSTDWPSETRGPQRMSQSQGQLPPQRPPVPNRPNELDNRVSMPNSRGESKRPNRNIPLLKKFGGSKNSSRNNCSKVNGQSALTKINRSNSSQYAELNETRGPTIIRPGTSANLKKKAPPPRPPPPKTTTTLNGLPSYEEVLQSDMNAFIGDLRRPTPDIPSGPRPPVPNNRRLPPPATSSHLKKAPQRPPSTTASLIDFDPLTPVPCPPTARSSSTATTSTSQTLLDLDDIFSCNDFPTANTWSTFHDGSQSTTRVASQPSNGRPMSINGASKGEDWLQSCLQDSGWDSGWPESPPNSPEPPSSSPPPVPYDFEAPPLPPRPKTQISKPHAVALFDYTAQQPDELNFKTKETIMLVHRVNSDWFYGYTDRSAGLFPSNFVQIIVPLPESKQITSGPRCRALYEFASENDADLSLRVGDIVALESKDQTGWYKGTLNGRTGLFPSSFVEIIEDLPQINSSKVEKWTVALYDFAGEAGELSFKEGQRVLMCSRVNDDWSIGRVEGSNYQGRFPNTFIQMLN